MPGSRRFVAAGRVVRATRRVGLGRGLHLAEQAIKRPLYGCQDCGDCSLPDIAFLCPESQCVKNQRNGQCGGSRNGECEVPGKDCIWARAYDRTASRGETTSLLRFPVTVQDNALRRSSSWANALDGQDVQARRISAPTGPTSATGPASASAPGTVSVEAPGTVSVEASVPGAPDGLAPISGPR